MITVYDYKTPFKETLINCYYIKKFWQQENFIQVTLKWNLKSIPTSEQL